MTGVLLMAEMKVFVINLDEQEKDTGCAWFTLPCNIEALKQSIGLPPDSDLILSVIMISLLKSCKIQTLTC